VDRPCVTACDVEHPAVAKATSIVAPPTMNFGLRQAIDGNGSGRAVPTLSAASWHFSNRPHVPECEAHPVIGHAPLVTDIVAAGHRRAKPLRW
jgi:hypothetical protein